MKVTKDLKKKSLSYAVLASLVANTVMPSTVTFAKETNYFVDDFEAGLSNWSFSKGDWSIENIDTNVLKQSSKSEEARAFRGEEEWTDYSVESKIKVLDFNGSNRALLCARYKDNNNYYAVALNGKDGGFIELRKKVDGKSTVIAKVNTEILVNKVYNVKLVVDGTNIKVYINNELLIDEEDSSLKNGAVGLISSKVIATYDDVVVSSLSDKVEDTEIKDEILDDTTNNDKIEDTEVKDEIIEESETINLEKYSVSGFASSIVSDKKVPMSSSIDELNSSSYVRVTNEVELAAALKKGSKVKVIEIMNDLDLGWNEIDAAAQKAPFTQNIVPLTHPTLKKTGVSKITVDSFDDLTIFSKNGSTIKHAGLVFKNSKNVVIRNLQFDELWEWDEDTKGDYDRNDWDYITLEGCNGVWIDHCTFGKAYDGIVDSKKGTKGVTISYSKFLPGDYKNDGFFTAMFDEMEKNSSKYPMYSFIKSQGLSKEDIMRVASPQKKTHLIGAKELDVTNNDLEITLHHNYYKDSQDRMPRLRGGNAHIYNIVMDCREAYSARNIVTTSISKSITAAGYHFGLTSNGAISTEGGALLMESSVILGVKNPFKNNQKSASKSEYTGKLQATDIVYEYGNISYRGDSTSKNSPLNPEPATVLEFSWNGFSSLSYEYNAEDPTTLLETLTGEEGAGAGVLNLSENNWIRTVY